MPIRRSVVANAIARLPQFYSTNFATTANPIVEDGGWVRGGSEGLDWTNPQVTSGYAWGTMPSFDGTNYIDSIAHRTGFTPNHMCRTVMRNVGAVSGLETEHFTRCVITPHSARGYESDFVLQPPQRVALVRWDGPKNSFTPMMLHNLAGAETFADGSVWDTWAQGPVISIYCNFALVLSLDVQAWAIANGGAYWADGNPGMGFWDEVNDGNGPHNTYGFKSYQASDI